MPTTEPDWPLAFGLTPTTWDGKTIGFRPEAELRQELSHHRDAGLKYVHIAGFHYEEACDFDLAEGVATMRGLLDEMGMELSSHHCLVPTFCMPGTDQSPVVERLLQTVELLAPLGSTALVVHPGRCWGYHETVEGFVDSYKVMAAQAGVDALIETSADNLRAMARAAAPHGFTIALENLGRWEPLADKELLPRLVNTIDEPNVGYCYDSGHAHAFGESQTWWLKTIGDRLFATHFHDNHARGVELYPPTGFVPNTREVDEHLPVGFGTIPWADVIRQLTANGYDGVVSFETGGWPIPDPVESFVQASAWWRASTHLALTGKRD